MLYILGLIVLPPLLVFGVYHLLLWVDLTGIRERTYPRRVALAAAVSHLVLAVGFFLFCYLDFRANGSIAGAGLGFDAFFFNHSPFWSLASVFDTAPTVILLGVFGALDRFEIGFGPTVPLTAATVLSVGTLQWYWIGAGIGAAFEKLWTGLKGPEDDEIPRNWL